MGKKRGADRYSNDQKKKFEEILRREQVAPRIPPVRRTATDLGMRATQPDRVGPNVVSKFFAMKVVNQREKDFWKKPWGRKRVDLPMPSYLRDFKDADTYLLAPHFNHYRRNVGISSNATMSETMMRSLSAPPVPTHGAPESEIYGSHSVRPPPRLPMIGLPPRTPLENSIEMEHRLQQGTIKPAQGVGHKSSNKSRTRDPKKMNAFIDQLTEAYALCSAHEQVAAEIHSLRDKALSKSVVLPQAPQAGDAPIGMLKTILGRSKLTR